MNRYVLLLRDKLFRFSVLSKYGFYNWMSDEQHICRKFRYQFGKMPNLNNPKTFNEKLQWLKLHDRKPEYSLLVDKYGVRSYIEELIGAQYLIPIVGGPWKHFDEIDFDSLPEQFVLKCTHDSGGLVICRQKQELDIARAKKKIEGSLRHNYFWNSREWPYKNVTPQIIAEKYMKDIDYDVLPVYKVFNFSGEPRIIQVILNDKTERETVDYYSVEWEHLPIKQTYPNCKNIVQKPKELDLILALARRISGSFPFLRTDFYLINGQVFFSEITFYSDSGMAKFDPSEWDNILGEWIELPSQFEEGAIGNEDYDSN